MKRLAILLLVLGVSACRTATEPALNEPFELWLNEPRRVEGTGLVFEFAEVIEDSRCPEGAMCIVAGRAEVRVNAWYASGPDILYTMRLVDRPDSSTVVVAGHFVEFQDLLPHPSIDGPVNPRSQRVRLLVRPALD